MQDYMWGQATRQLWESFPTFYDLSSSILSGNSETPTSHLFLHLEENTWRLRTQSSSRGTQHKSLNFNPKNPLRRFVCEPRSVSGGLSQRS